MQRWRQRSWISYVNRPHRNQSIIICNRRRPPGRTLMAIVHEVALIVNLNKDYDRKIAASISRYAHTAGNWRIYLEDELANRMPDFHHWRGHGVIADIDDEQILRRVLRLAVPWVGIGGTPIDLIPPRIAYVSTDNVRVAQLAAEHLLERGLRHFAYCGIPQTHHNSFARAR